MRATARAVRAAGAAMALVAVLLVAGCTATSGAGSRAALYDGLDAMAADSAAVVVVQVVDTAVTDDTRLSTVEVANTPHAPRLAENLAGGADDVAVGDTLHVRQMARDPGLVPGAQYLLYLTPTMLPSDDATTFFVTGATAGIYFRSGTVFARVDPESGDTLPATIDIAF